MNYKNLVLFLCDSNVCDHFLKHHSRKISKIILITYT